MKSLLIKDTTVDERMQIVKEALGGFGRQDILQYLKEKKQDFVTDSTNLEDDALRNKIRHHVPRRGCRASKNPQMRGYCTPRRPAGTDTEPHQATRTGAIRKKGRASCFACPS